MGRIPDWPAVVGSAHAIHCKRTGHAIGMEPGGGACACASDAACRMIPVQVAHRMGAKMDDHREIDIEVAADREPARTMECQHGADDGHDESWTMFPIIYDNTVGVERAMRLQIDSVGQGRLTVRSAGQVTMLGLEPEQSADLQHMLLRGLNRFALEQRKGWAA